MPHDELGGQIARGRERARLTRAQLGEAVGLSQSAISRTESRERSVDSLELAAIAKHLGVSVLDLLEERPVPNELLALAVRVEAARAPGAVQGHPVLRGWETPKFCGSPGSGFLDFSSSLGRWRSTRGLGLEKTIEPAQAVGRPVDMDQVDVVEEPVGDLAVVRISSPAKISGQSRTCLLLVRTT